MPGGYLVYQRKNVFLVILIEAIYCMKSVLVLVKCVNNSAGRSVENLGFHQYGVYKNFQPHILVAVRAITHREYIIFVYSPVKQNAERKARIGDGTVCTGCGFKA